MIIINFIFDLAALGIGRTTSGTKHRETHATGTRPEATGMAI